MSLPGKKSGCPGIAFAENDLVLVKHDERASINALTFMVSAQMNWHFAILQLVLGDPNFFPLFCLHFVNKVGAAGSVF